MDDSLVKMEPDAQYHQSVSTIDDTMPATYTASDESIMNFVTFRCNLEQTSQMLTESWTQLQTILDTYKAQIFSTESTTMHVPNSTDLMNLLMTKERENNKLREDLRELTERYNNEKGELVQKVLVLSQEVATERNQKASQKVSSGQKISRLESKIRVLEGKLEKSPLKPTRTSTRWSSRPSGRLLPGAGLVERRTPTPTQVARVTPVTTPDKLQPVGEPYPASSIKTETETDSGSSRTDTGDYDSPASYTGQKYVVNSGQSQMNYGLGEQNLQWGYSGQGGESTQNQSLFLCPHCTQSFNNEPALDHHLRASHRKFICPKCYEQYSKKYDLLNHIGLVHGKKARTDEPQSTSEKISNNWSK